MDELLAFINQLKLHYHAITSSFWFRIHQMDLEKVYLSVLPHLFLTGENSLLPHFVYFSHDREDSVIQRTWVEGTGTQLSTGLHWLGAERDQQVWL